MNLYALWYYRFAGSDEIGEWIKRALYFSEEVRKVNRFSNELSVQYVAKEHDCMYSNYFAIFVPILL